MAKQFWLEKITLLVNNTQLKGGTLGRCPWSSYKKNLVVTAATVQKISNQNNQSHSGRLLQSPNQGRSWRGERRDPAEIKVQPITFPAWLAIRRALILRQIVMDEMGTVSLLTLVSSRDDATLSFCAHASRMMAMRPARGNQPSAVFHQVNRWSNRCPGVQTVPPPSEATPSRVVLPQTMLIRPSVTEKNVIFLSWMLYLIKLKRIMRAHEH